MQFRVLGPLQVLSEAGEVALPAGRHRALLATLLLRANQLVSTGELVERLWGNAAPADARGTTQTYVHRLRRVLGPGRIHTRPDGYLISIGVDDLDLARFNGLLERAGRVGDCGEEAALLAEALSLWRGPALSNVPSDVLHRDEVPGLTERRLRALERRIDLDLSVGRHPDLIAELRTLTGEYPLRERFWEPLMTALAGCGRPAEALQAYQELRVHLADELGVDPGPALQQLHQAVLRGEAYAATTPFAISTPAVTWQPGDRNGSVPRPLAPAQLPADIAGFTGRGCSLHRLDTLLPNRCEPRADPVQILVIEGVAGIGKTALAVHWAHQVRDRFCNGQLYINLRGHATDPPLRPVDALGVFLPALGVPAEQVPTDEDTAAAMYRSLLADKRMLVVLDNAAHPDQVRPLLPGGSGCAVLVTSRHHLGGLVARDGASRLVLDVLNPEEARSLLARLLGADRLAAEPGAAGHLARLCGHLPLALRIAAAHLTELAGQSIADYNTHLASSGPVTALAIFGDDQATVRAAFDLSYNGLCAPAQRMFRLLGLAPGADITAAAAAALADTTLEQAEDLLRHLASAHLIEQHTAGRYTLHDLLRHYAVSRCHGEDPQPHRVAAAHRYSMYYMHTADSATRLLYPQSLRLPRPAGHTTGTGVTNRGEALAWLDAERANLVTIVNHCAEHGPRQTAWLIADTLRTYFHMRMHTVDWLTVARAGLTAAQHENNLQAQAAAHLSLGDLLWRQGRHEEGIPHATTALTLAQRAGWAEGQTAIRSGLGAVCWQAGHLHQAAEHLSQVLNQQPAQAPHESNSCTDGTTNTPGELPESLRKAALDDIHHAWGQLDPALDHFNRSLAIDRATAADHSRTMTLCILARVHRDAGRTAQALELAEYAVTLALATDHHRLQAEAHNTLASAHLHLGNQAQATQHYQHALRIAKTTTDQYALVEALIGLATTHHLAGQHQYAHHLIHQAITAARQAGLRLLEGQALTTLAVLDLDRSDPHQAITHAEQALAIHHETGHRLGQAQIHHILSHAHQLTGSTHDATDHRHQADSLYTSIGVTRTGKRLILDLSPTRYPPVAAATGITEPF